MNPKSLLKGSSKDVKKNNSGKVNQYRPGYKLMLTKKLNPLGYFVIFSGYTMAIVLTTIFTVTEYMPANQQASKISTYDLKQEILSELKDEQRRRRGFAIEQNQRSQDTVSSRDLAKFKDEMISKVNKMSIGYLEMLETNKKNSHKQMQELAIREPASVKIKNGKVLRYSNANKNILWFKHHQVVKNLKKQLKAKKESYMASIDLTNPSDQKKLQAMQDEMELMVYSKREELQQLRYKFEEDKYIVLSQSE